MHTFLNKIPAAACFLMLVACAGVPDGGQSGGGTKVGLVDDESTRFGLEQIEFSDTTLGASITAYFPFIPPETEEKRVGAYEYWAGHSYLFNGSCTSGKLKNGVYSVRCTDGTFERNTVRTEDGEIVSATLTGVGRTQYVRTFKSRE